MGVVDLAITIPLIGWGLTHYPVATIAILGVILLIGWNGFPKRYARQVREEKMAEEATHQAKPSEMGTEGTTLRRLASSTFDLLIRRWKAKKDGE
jgi:hypothetical protein